MTKKISLLFITFLLNFTLAILYGATIKLVDGTRAIVQVLSISDKGALVKAEGMEPVFIEKEEIEWLVMDERYAVTGFTGGMLLKNGLRTYSDSFEITDKGGHISSVHGTIIVGGIGDILAIDYKTFSSYQFIDAIRENIDWNKKNLIEVDSKTAKTIDESIFRFESIETQNEKFVFEIGTIKFFANTAMLKEINFKIFGKDKTELPGGLLFSFQTGSELSLTNGQDFWLTGTLGRTRDGNFQLSNTLSSLQVSRIVIQKTKGVLKWKFATNAPVGSSPAMGQDGTIYVGSRDNYLYAIRPDGTLKWRFQTGGWIESSPAIGQDGTIYVGSYDNYLYSITPDGKLKWRFQTGGYVYSSPAIGQDGTIYVGSRDNYLYAIRPDGTLKWRFQTGGWIESSPAIGQDGTIYVGSRDSYLYAISPDGKLKWRFQTGDWIGSSPAIGQDGTIYVGSYDNYLYSITPDGKLKWRFQTGGYVYSSPAIGQDGTIYVGSRDNYLYAIRPDGTLKWRFQTGGWIGSSPAIGQDGTIYVGSEDKHLYAISPDGTLKWRFQTGGGIGSSLAIGADGTVYFGSGDSYLYAIQTTSFGLADTPWPKFRGNLRNTGVFGEK